MKSSHRRTHEITRLEGFSDAVFAFSATLLVVSLEVPHTYAELVADLKGFLGFALSFAALILIWAVHNGFFRRFGLQDRVTVVLNSVLLFVMLFYVFPLKFMAEGIAHMVLGESSYQLSSLRELGSLFAIYGAAFAAVFACVALMYRHVVSARDRLGLDAEATGEAQMLARHYLIFASVGALSVATSLAGVGVAFGLPGFLYMLLGPLCWAHGIWTRRRAAGHPAA
jgi:uncharacterized membrane protein